MSIYDLTVKTRKGEDFALSGLRGKLLLIVNTATGCGFTPQYEALERLYEAYHDRGLEVLDFPCNQFGHQAPARTRRSTPSAPASTKPNLTNSRRSTSTASTRIPFSPS